MEKFQKNFSLVILVLVLIGVIFISLIGFIADYLWFQEMGYLSVFFTQLVTQLKVGIPTFVVITGLVYLYLSRLKKGYFSKIASSEDTNLKKLNKIIYQGEAGDVIEKTEIVYLEASEDKIIVKEVKEETI